MIYESVEADAPLRQGDIFVRIPRSEFQFNSIPVLADDAILRVQDWLDVSTQREGVDVIMRIRPTMGIVITQDCDATRARDVSLCEIRPFHDVDAYKRDQNDTPKKWVSLITQHARMNQKWFYLPVDPSFQINERSAVDFRVVMNVPMAGLAAAAGIIRVGRLNPVATSHFRERIAEFFRRYPYDEWYPLTKDEFQFYDNDKGPVEPFDWQRP
jgi:hypothetical protein